MPGMSEPPRELAALSVEELRAALLRQRAVDAELRTVIATQAELHEAELAASDALLAQLRSQVVARTDARGTLVARVGSTTLVWRGAVGSSPRPYSWWTGASARTILRSMTTHAQRCPTCGDLLATDKGSLLPPDVRLTPWMIHDLPRIAWIVEYRAAELTDEERQIVRDATTRMLRALEHDTV